MFTSTGNNFGAGAIEFKDYQNEHEIVLNAAFDFDSSSEEYQKAKVLEIYVPDLSLGKSAVTHVFFGAGVNTEWFGTVLKAWIKDRNTICIEKLNPWPNHNNFRIWFCSMFATRGHRGIEVEVATMNGCSLKHDGPIGYISNQKYYETDNYVLLMFSTNGLAWKYEGVSDQIYNYTPFPSDIHAKLPFVCGLVSWTPRACVMLEVEWDGEFINVPEYPKGYGSGTGYDPLFYAFVVRDGISETNDSGETGNIDPHNEFDD